VITTVAPQRMDRRANNAAEHNTELDNRPLDLSIRAEFVHRDPDCYTTEPDTFGLVLWRCRGLKRILKLDRLRLRGPNGAKDEFLLAATAQNLRTC
jgi:hypothetical protein